MGEIFKFYVEYPYFELLLAIIENASQQVEIGLCFQQIVVFVHRYSSVVVDDWSGEFAIIANNDFYFFKIILHTLYLISLS